MRRPGAPALRRFHRGSRLLRTPSLCGRQEDEHPSPLLEQDLSSLWRTPPLAAAAPSLQNSPVIGERARQLRVFRTWKESSRTSRESPAGITPMPAPFSARWARKNGICRAVHSRKGSADPRRNLLSPIPICRRQAFMCAISHKASFPPAVSVARYRQIAWPQASPSSAWCRFPVCACLLASLKRRICCTFIRTGTATQCCVSIFAHAHPLS